MNTKIPFSKTHIFSNELKYLKQTLESGFWSGDREFSKRAEAWLGEKYNFSKVLLTPSCTASLELMALLLEFKPGDEVIMPSFTFPTTASAIALRGATPRFVDINDDTLNITLNEVLPAINNHTKAIMVVHYGGYSCEILKLKDFCKSKGIYLLEDAAQCIHSYYSSQALGSFGDLGAMSFHETKNISCGEGGALFVNNESLIEKAEIIREKGTNRSQFLRGEIDKYSWQKLGSSYLLSEFNAAILLAQLEGAQAITQHRLNLWNNYHQAFSELESTGKLKRPKVIDGAQGNGHIYWITLPDEIKKNSLQNYLNELGISATSHFVPLHLSKAGKAYGKTYGELLKTESLANRILRLPLYYDLNNDQSLVIDAVLDYFKLNS